MCKAGRASLRWQPCPGVGRHTVCSGASSCPEKRGRVTELERAQVPAGSAGILQTGCEFACEKPISSCCDSHKSHVASAPSRAAGRAVDGPKHGTILRGNQESLIRGQAIGGANGPLSIWFSFREMGLPGKSGSSHSFPGERTPCCKRVGTDALLPFPPGWLILQGTRQGEDGDMGS